MSWDMTLVDPVSHDPLHLNAPHHMGGGTQAVGGTTELWLNVTGNYSRLYSDDFSLGNLHLMTGADSIPILQREIDRLGDETSEDYWTATEGNAKRALLQLQAMAKMRPDGLWSAIG